MIHAPRKQTPTSGVIVEVLYLAAVALGGGLSAWAIQRANRPTAGAKTEAKIADGLPNPTEPVE